MSKIQETISTIKAGARTNKYRILYPVFGKELDIVCHSATAPGREISTVDVFIKGRKYQLAGEMADEGTWEMTIYNTPDLLHRRFFLKMIGGIHNFNTPDYLQDGGIVPPSKITGGTNLSVHGNDSGSSVFDGDLGDLLSNVSSAVGKINQAYTDIKSTFSAVKRTSNNIKQLINGDWTALETFISDNNYTAKPWYQHDIIIQQLDHNEEVIATSILNNAFVKSVSPIEYSDETQEISKTTITFAYSGIEYGTYSELPSIEKY